MVERSRVLVVPNEHAAELLRRLHSLRLVDRTVKTTKEGRSVLVPLVAEPTFDVTRYGARIDPNRVLRARSIHRDPRARLVERLTARGIRPHQAPRGWERIGDILVVRVPRAGRAQAKAIGEIFGTVLGARTVVEDVSGIHGPLRTPEVRFLWGDGTETVHVESGVRYALDVARLMFSSGNLAERTGVARRVRPGAVVVDLFAGIGYFTLPIALRSRARTIFACELNPVGFRYLVENLRLNRATNVVPLLGDCRTVAPQGVADWVIMGHFDARDYLDVAFRALRGKGRIVYHEVCPKEQFPDAFARRLAAAARSHWMNVTRMETRIVKSYAPGIVHVAAELEAAPQIRGPSTESRKSDERI